MSKKLLTLMLLLVAASLLIGCKGVVKTPTPTPTSASTQTLMPETSTSEPSSTEEPFPTRENCVPPFGWKNSGREAEVGIYIEEDGEKILIFLMQVVSDGSKAEVTTTPEMEVPYIYPDDGIGIVIGDRIVAVYLDCEGDIWVPSTNSDQEG